MVNFGALSSEICWRVWVTPTNFQRVLRLGGITAQHSSSGHQPKFAALNRGRHLYSAGRPSRWALDHILVVFILCCYTLLLIGECVLLLCSAFSSKF